MNFIRRHARLWVTAWLVLQAVSLSAFVPRDCCADHRPAAATPSCHEAAAPTHCPMRGADGAPCPMHRAPAPSPHAGHDTPAAHDGDQHPGGSAGDCVIRGTCQGPTFVSVLSYPAILPDPAVLAIRVDTPTPAADLREHPITRFRVPDPRPPRG